MRNERWDVCILCVPILVPRPHDPSGLWQGSRALAWSSASPTPEVCDSRTSRQIWQIWLSRIQNEYSAHAQKIGWCQNSRSLPQNRRIVGSGDENGACHLYLYKDPSTSHRIQNILITVCNGLQGCKYCHDKFQRDYGPWTAFRTLDYGYTRVQVFNSSHLYLEQVSIDQVSGTCMQFTIVSTCEWFAWQRFYERKFQDNFSS